MKICLKAWCHMLLYPPLSQTFTPSRTPSPRAWRTLWTVPYICMSCMYLLIVYYVICSFCYVCIYLCYLCVCVYLTYCFMLNVCCVAVHFFDTYLKTSQTVQVNFTILWEFSLSFLIVTICLCFQFSMALDVQFRGAVRPHRCRFY